MKILAHDTLKGKKVPADIINLTAEFRHNNSTIIIRNMDNISIPDGDTLSQSTTDAQIPSYSRSIDGTWYGFDRQLNTITQGFKTHKELKNEYDVVSVKGIDVDGEKIYGLITKPQGGINE